MEAKELRIGNWVKCYPEYNHNGDEKYDEVDINIAHISDIVTKSKEFFYQPIPLTEQWLIDFGFDCNYCGWSGWYNIEDIIIRKTVTGCFFPMTLIAGTNFEHQSIGSQIHYVHQLQNLYYALTGEELIKK